MEKRTKRSGDRREALQYLVEALADRSEVEAVVLVDEQGSIVAGIGMPNEVRGLAKLAAPTLQGERSPLFDEMTEKSDFFGRAIPLESGSLYLAVLGTRVRKMHEAVYAVRRIIGATPESS